MADGCLLGNGGASSSCWYDLSTPLDTDFVVERLPTAPTTSRSLTETVPPRTMFQIDFFGWPAEAVVCERDNGD